MITINNIIRRLLNVLSKVSYKIYYFTKCKENQIILGYPPETLKCRSRLAKYCVGNGLDIGFGGYSINDTAITLDKKIPHVDFGFRKTNFIGDACDLSWLRDNSLDYIFSSHVLEDFENTLIILLEWIRVLKVGGRLVLYLPDQKSYSSYCLEKGQSPNPNHKIDDFSLSYIKQIIKNIPYCRVIHCLDKVNDYSFEIVIEKTNSV